MDDNSILKVHPWITTEFFKEILESLDDVKTEYTEIKDVRMVLEPAVGKGENFHSDVIRAHITYRKGFEKCPRQTTFFIKAGFATPENKEMLKSFDVFLREIIVYRDILPQVDKLLLSIGEETQLAPKCYKIGEHEREYFVFEDLVNSGFKLVERKLGLDPIHFKLVADKLAKWHAATAFLHSQDPGSMKYHLKGNITEDIPDFHQYYRNVIRACADEANTWPGFESYAAKLHKLEKIIIQKGCEVFDRDDSAFNVLNQGDLWIGNLIFKYDDNGIPYDVVMFDFAIGWWGSPGIDLSFLLSTSSQESVTESQWDEVVRTYHETLKNVLEKLKYPKEIPTLSDIHAEIVRKGILGLIYSAFLIPIRLLDNAADIDLSGLLNEDEAAIASRKKLFGAPKYKIFMTFLLDYYDRKGLLDC